MAQFALQQRVVLAVALSCRTVHRWAFSSRLGKPDDVTSQWLRLHLHPQKFDSQSTGNYIFEWLCKWLNSIAIFSCGKACAVGGVIVCFKHTAVVQMCSMKRRLAMEAHIAPCRLLRFCALPQCRYSGVGGQFISDKSIRDLFGVALNDHSDQHSDHCEQHHHRTQPSQALQPPADNE